MVRAAGNLCIGEQPGLSWHKPIASPAPHAGEGEIMSAVQEDREMAFPHLNPSSLGSLPGWRVREAPR